MSDDSNVHRLPVRPKLRTVTPPPVHEVLVGIADELESMATGKAPTPADLHALSQRVDELAERVLQDGRA